MRARPLFIVYPRAATIDDAAVDDDALSAPDFYRYAPERRLVRLLRQLGDVIGIDVAEQANDIAAHATKKHRQSLLINFTEPQWLPTGISCKTVAAFSWPYETVPVESWGAHSHHDWRIALRDCAGVISFSQHAATVISNTVGLQLPVHGINPLLKMAAIDVDPIVPARGESWHIDVHGVVFDSQAMGLATATTITPPNFTPAASRISLRGVVYTSVINPIDDAKNWLDTLHGFGIAFRDNADVTLVLKLCHPDAMRACMTAMQGLQKLLPFCCRIIIIVAQLDAAQYATLVRNSCFYISSAHAHGKGTAILEFMQAGVPVIAPRHTAVRTWLDDNNSFAIDCSREWTYWPHDAREKLCTYRYRIVWESIRQQLLRSHDIATQQPSHYQRMTAHARASGICHGSADVAALSAWLATLGISTVSISRAPKSPLATSFSDKLGALRRWLRPDNKR